MHWSTLVVALYLVILGLLCFQGAHRIWLLWAYRQPRPHDEPDAPEVWPTVTVQLPVFNERAVVVRLIEAAAALKYPRDRLQIQVLDDSLDDTTELARIAVERLASQGVDIELRHRVDRTGFKAGALEEGLKTATGELVAIFDADFVPQPDFLERTVPWFAPNIGMVQARWGHLNAGDSWLTHAQSILLDAHFLLEHGARHRAGRWFNFNGTAGVWRREAIAAAGGWQHDTLTEDLDLSYRAQLQGWDFVFVDQHIAPAELPPTIAAFKTQQHRWAKGSVQTCRKLFVRIWSSDAALPRKLEATAHLTANFSYPLVVLLTVLLPWSVLARSAYEVSPWLLALDAVLFVVAVVPFVLFYGVAVRDGSGPSAGTPEARRRWWRLPSVLALGIGMALSQTRAVLEGLFGEVGSFVRTPKKGAGGMVYRAAVHGIVWLEALLAVYLLGSFVLVALYAHPATLPFLGLFTAGYGLVAGQTLLEQLSPRGPRALAPTSRP